MMKMKLGIGFFVVLLSVTLSAGEYGAIQLFRLNQKLIELNAELSYTEDRIIGHQETREFIQRGREKLLDEMESAISIRQNSSIRRPLGDVAQRKMVFENCLYKKIVGVDMVAKKCDKALAAYIRDRSEIVKEIDAISKGILFLREHSLRQVITDFSNIDIS